MNKPTCEQLFNEELDSVKVTDESGWRHGITRIEVFHRKEDDTYWEACYRISTDGETHTTADRFARQSVFSIADGRYLTHQGDLWSLLELLANKRSARVTDDEAA
ncbi:MAG: hypothetical protein AABY22_15770, partial [Nanoarchaeota archaeon]